MIRHAAASLLAWLAVSSGAYAENSQCQFDNGVSAYPITANLGYTHDRFGTQPRGLSRTFQAYRSSFDDRPSESHAAPAARAIPRWVAYQVKMHPRDATGEFAAASGANRPKRWYEDAELISIIKGPKTTATSLAASYRGDDGTFTPLQLVSQPLANRVSWQAGCNTYYFNNAIPQLPRFEQGIWRHLDTLVGAWANKYGAVWVVSGPVFFPSREIVYLGGDGDIPVAIPHAVFKIVVRQEFSDEVPRTLAFMYPQWEDGPYKSGDCARDKSYAHETYLVSIDAIERITGLSFFNNVRIDSRDRKRMKSQRATELWPVEPYYFGDEC